MGEREPRQDSLRVVRVSGWLCLLALCLFGCGLALAGSGSELQVLLYDRTEAVMLGSSKALQEIRLADPNGLFVPGRVRLHSWIPSGQGPWRVAKRTVRGRIDVRAKQGRIQVLNRVDLEDYVASTVGGEMMARCGHSYERILSTFYPGARLETRRSRRIASRGPEPGIEIRGRGVSGGD